MTKQVTTTDLVKELKAIPMPKRRHRLLQLMDDNEVALHSVSFVYHHKLISNDDLIYLYTHVNKDAHYRWLYDSRLITKEQANELIKDPAYEVDDDIQDLYATEEEQERNRHRVEHAKYLIDLVDDKTICVFNTKEYLAKYIASYLQDPVKMPDNIGGQTK